MKGTTQTNVNGLLEIIDLTKTFADLKSMERCENEYSFASLNVSRR